MRGWPQNSSSMRPASCPMKTARERRARKKFTAFFTVVMQSRFAAVLTTDEWIAALDSGEPPACNNIYASNQKARFGSR